MEIVKRAWAVFNKGFERGDPGVLFDRGVYTPEATITLVGEVPGAQSVYVGQAGLPFDVRGGILR